MIPALADIRTLRRLADRVQSQTSGELLEIVEIVADGSLRPEPIRLGLPDGWSEFDLDELGRGRHAYFDSSKPLPEGSEWNDFTPY
jgi:hypothetical protein